MRGEHCSADTRQDRFRDESARSPLALGLFDALADECTTVVLFGEQLIVRSAKDSDVCGGGGTAFAVRIFVMEL